LHRTAFSQTCLELFPDSFAALEVQAALKSWRDVVYEIHSVESFCCDKKRFEFRETTKHTLRSMFSQETVGFATIRRFWQCQGASISGEALYDCKKNIKIKKDLENVCS